jgi:hypothetical protein
MQYRWNPSLPGGAGQFGKLYRVGPQWDRSLFNVTSWGFFRVGEFDKVNPSLFLAYVTSEDDEYRSDLFIFPIKTFAKLISAAPLAGGKYRVYISRSNQDRKRWFLRRQNTFKEICEESCFEVSQYRRAFHQLD